MRRYNAHQFRVDESPDGALVFFSEVEGLLLSNQRLRKELDHYKRLAAAAAPDMLEALITDYLVFKNYENIHNAKGNVEKAFSNKAQADRIRGIIEYATGETIDEVLK